MYKPSDEEIATKEQTARSQPVPSVLSDAELKTWHRRVGRMPYEQAEALSETLKAQRTQHDETGCPLCRWITEHSRNDLCPAGEELAQARRAGASVRIIAAGDVAAQRHMQEELRLEQDAGKALRQHLRTCPDCVSSRYHHAESCPYGDQLQHMWHYAVHRAYAVQPSY